MLAALSGKGRRKGKQEGGRRPLRYDRRRTDKSVSAPVGVKQIRQIGIAMLGVRCQFGRDLDSLRVAHAAPSNHLDLDRDELVASDRSTK
jgi:hypothetical protein